MDDSKFTRAELLSGGLNRARRAAKLFSMIEARCLHLRDESRRVVAAYLLEGDEEFKRRFELSYVESLKLVATTTEALQLDHFERFSPQWRYLLPSDPDLRATILRLVWQKYGMGSATYAALGGEEKEVQESYRAIFNSSLEDLVSQAGENAKPLIQTAVEPEAWRDVETRLEWLNLAGGEVLYRAGDPGNALFVVISGRVQALTVVEDGSENLVGEIGRGELLGELEVLTGDVRSTTVRAVRDSELVRLDRDALFALAQRHLQVMVQINRLIARRLRQQYLTPGRKDSTLLSFTLLPCDGSVPIQAFGRQFIKALSEFGQTMYVTCNTLDDAIEPGASQATWNDPRNPQIVSWLSELETRYRYVVYEAAPEVSEWSQRCIRQADRILLVGRSGSSPEPANHESALLAGEAKPLISRAGSPNVEGKGTRAYEPVRAAQTELVLLHSADANKAEGTARWLAARCVGEHYHVREGNTDDMGRLVRRLTGHAFGLVLGGGGARGFAHIGVYRALQEAGIEVDIVAGTSMGALIAGGIGKCMSASQMRGIAQQLSSPSKIFDLTLPIVSLFSGAKTTRAFRQIYGDTLIEDLWRPMFCISTNVTRANPVIHRQGQLWEAIRASMSLPGIYPPVLHQGDLLVDGGVMNNLPIDIMRQVVQGGCILAVNVSPPEDLVKPYHYGPSISGTRALLSKVNRDDNIIVPVIHECLMRIMVLHDVYGREAKRQLADIYIAPPVHEFGLLELGSYDPIIEIGYKTAQEAIGQVNERLADLRRQP